MFVELNKQVGIKSGKSVVVRSIRSDDGELLGTFFASIPKQDQYYFYPHKLDIANGFRVVAEMASDRSIRIIATIGDDKEEQIVGYSFIQDKGADIPFGFGICIDNRFQSEGIGKVILHELLKQAGDHEIKFVTLTVHQENRKALELYRNVGFKITGDFINKTQGSKAYSMKLKIDQEERP